MTDLIIILILLYLVQAAHSFNGVGAVFGCDWRGRWKEKSSKLMSDRRGRTFCSGRLIPPLRGVVICSGDQRSTESLTQHKQVFEERFELYRERSSWTRSLADLLFVYLVAVVPYTISVFGVSRTWIVLVCGLATLQISSFAFFRRAFKSLYPTKSNDGFSSSLTILLSPIAALRMDDVLLKSLAEGIHPVVVAAVLLDSSAARKFSWKNVLRLQSEGRVEEAAAITRFAKVDSSEMQRNHARKWFDSTQFCPLCDAEYDSTATVCSDCSVRLLAVTQAPSGR